MSMNFPTMVSIKLPMPLKILVGLGMAGVMEKNIDQTNTVSMVRTVIAHANIPTMVLNILHAMPQFAGLAMAFVAAIMMQRNPITMKGAVILSQDPCGSFGFLFEYHSKIYF